MFTTLGNYPHPGARQHHHLYGDRQHSGMHSGGTCEEATEAVQLFAGQPGNERSLRVNSGNADGVSLPNIRHLAFWLAHVRSLGQLRCSQLHRQHPQSLHDISGPVSNITS